MYYIAIGLKNGIELARISPYGVGITKQQLQEIADASNEYGVNPDGTIDESAQSTAFESNGKPDSPALRDWAGKGRIVVSSRFKGKEIKVAYHPICYELIIDGKVYAEHKKMVWNNLTLTANLEGIEYKFQLNGLKQTFTLYANDVVISV